MYERDYWFITFVYNSELKYSLRIFVVEIYQFYLHVLRIISDISSICWNLILWKYLDGGEVI